MNWTRLAVVATVALGVGASAFLALRSDDRPSGHPARESPPATEGGTAPRPVPVRPPPLASGAPSLAPLPPATPPDASPAAPRQQAQLALEGIREELVAGCSRELGDARTPLAFRVRLVFDGTGREVIRSVMAEQKSPQPISNCLARVAAGKLRIAPPGRTVTVIVPLTIP